MEVKIGDEEGGGADDGGNHADFVLQDAAQADENVAGEKENGAGAVEKRVEARQRCQRNEQRKKQQRLFSARGRSAAFFVTEIKKLQCENAADHQADQEKHDAVHAGRDQAGGEVPDESEDGDENHDDGDDGYFEHGVTFRFGMKNRIILVTDCKVPVLT